MKTSSRTRLTCSFLAGFLTLCANANSAMAADIFAPPSAGCDNLMGQSTNLCVQGNRDTLGVYLQEAVDAHSSGQSSSVGSSSVDAQRSQKTADSVPDPRALAYESGRDARHRHQERDLRATLPLVRTTTTRVLSLQQHSTATTTTKTPDASPRRKRFFTRRRQSSTLTGPESINFPPTCHIRTDSSPRSSRSPPRLRPT